MKTDNHNLDELIKKCCLINNIKYPKINDEKYISVQCKYIFRLMKTNYAIFFTNKFYNGIRKWFKKSLLKYFKNYDIVYLNYNTRDDILNIINIINKIIVIYNKFVDSFVKDSPTIQQDYENEYNKGSLLYKLHK